MSMSVAASTVRELRASYAFVERNINLSKRYWGWELVFLCYSVAGALSVLYIGRAADQFGGGGKLDTNRLILYLTVGALVWSYLSSVFDSISETISYERWEGTIEYTMMAPVYRVTHLLGASVFSVIYGLVRTGVILLVIGLFFGVDLSHVNIGGAAAVILLGSFSFMGLGIMAAILPLLFTERGSQMTHIISASLLLVSGVYYPINVLPLWMQGVAHVSPALYALDGMRAAMIDGQGIGGIWHPLVGLTLIGLVTIPLGVLMFLRAERFAKRTGRLKRSG
jgi:ABC-2 type transport system permease protein